MPIEISPAPDMFLVEFIFGREPNSRTSIILPATCGLASMTKAWTLFPEYKRQAVMTNFQPIKYVEIDWQSGRVVIVKKKCPPIPTFKTEELDKPRKRKKADAESGE